MLYSDVQKPTLKSRVEAYMQKFEREEQLNVTSPKSSQ